ncbi:MMPL family transporter [Marinobacter nauticus]
MAHRSTHHWLALLWAIALVFMGVQLTSRLSASAFDTSILALLPHDKRQPVVDRALERMDGVIANRVLLLIGGAQSDRAQLQALAGEIADDLSASDAFTSVTTQADAGSLSALAAVYQPYRYQLLTDEVEERLVKGETEPLVSRAVREMVSPIGPPRPASVVDDPLNLLGMWMEGLTPATGFVPDEHGLYARQGNEHFRVIRATFTGDPFAEATQRLVLSAVESARQRVQNHGVATEFLRSGLVFHAAAGAEQARSELSTIGIGSLVAIVLLLLWHFGSFSYLALPVVSVAVGLLVALSVSLLVFERVHLVTLAFGASLVGVSIDYAFHYLCHARDRATHGIRHILPGITLGVVTSCLAYGAQALTPFPGLQQIALFSAAGLIGAWLTVVLWFPLAQRWLGQGRQQNRLGQWLQGLVRFRGVLAVLLGGLALVALSGFPGLRFNDSLSALQSSPPDLMAQEQKVQALSESPGSARFLLVEGESIQQVLERAEQASGYLDKLVVDGRLQVYQSVSGWVPSIVRQREYRQLVKNAVFDRGVPSELFDALGMPPKLASRSQARFENNDAGWLLPQDLEQSPVAELSDSLWLKTDNSERPHAALITLGKVSSPAVYEDLAALAGKLEGVRFVDRVGQTSALLGDYRATLSQWMALAYGLVLLVLIVRYGWQCWRVILPPALATVVTLGLLSALGQPLNLFNLLATLLILGIGLDIGIFVRESHGEWHAWEAVTLSAVTSLLAFGLLALSETPVLHHYGMTVLPGIALAWLIAFVLHRRAES